MGLDLDRTLESGAPALAFRLVESNLMLQKQHILYRGHSVTIFKASRPVEDENSLPPPMPYCPNFSEDGDK